MAVIVEDKSLRPFEDHGVSFTRRSGTQAVGACPFCGKEDHLYVNATNGLWDCKVCGKKGNVSSFLGFVAEVNAKALTGKPLADLVENRGIPAETFERHGIGWDGSRYTIPVRDYNGRVVDLRKYKLGGHPQATAGVETGLWGAERIAKGNGSVYVCEGEWDGLALDTLAHKLGKSITITAVPGANTFKRDWVPWLQNKDVFTLYDHDSAGEDGERLALERLSGSVKGLRFVHWPEDAPEGFDTRDWVRYGLKLGKAEGCWLNLHKLFDTKPNKMAPGEKLVLRGTTDGPAEGTLSSSKVIEVYRKWLQLEEPEVLSATFGACFANRLEGEPIWLFIVAPPGGMKSELIMSMKGHPSVYATTSLTPHALISGATWSNGKDPSLIPQLDGKILALKDFTTILSMNELARDEIFGSLRDAYDGTTGKTFGTGVRREYQSKFGILAGVTNKIEAFAVMHQSLGERFLKFKSSEKERESDEQKIVRALGNLNREIAMRKELGAAAEKCLNRALPDKIPQLQLQVVPKLVALAQLVAMMRGVVERDRYTQSVQYRPSYEVGTRLAKQLAKLAMGMAIFLEKESVGENEYRLIRRVGMDTAPDRVEIIVRRLWECSRENGELVRTQRVSELTRLPQNTIFRVLQDLELLNIVDRSGDGMKHTWKLNAKMVRLIEVSEAYRQERSRLTLRLPTLHG